LEAGFGCLDASSLDELGFFEGPDAFVDACVADTSESSPGFDGFVDVVDGEWTLVGEDLEDGMVEVGFSAFED